MNDKEKFDIARELIRHEDDLINNRVTWLLVLQGFLLAAFVNGIGLYEKFSNSPRSTACLTIGLILIGGLGITSSLVARNVLRIAFRRMEEVKAWWEQTRPSENFPPIAGKLDKGCFYFVFSTGRMPCILIGVWCVLILLLLVVV
jgi:hypothetical protein